MYLKYFTEVTREEGTGNLILIPRELTETLAAGLVRRGKGEKTALAAHPDEEEIYLILKGKGILRVDGEERPLEGGMVAYIPRHAQHEIEGTSAEEPLEYIYIANFPDEGKTKRKD